MTTPIEFNRARFFDAVEAGNHLAHSVLARERELTSSKWFGYRMMSPLAATMRFYDTYADARVRYVKTEIDIGLVGRLNSPPFSRLSRSDFAAAWTARQRADQYAVPYPLYLDFAHHFKSRRSGRGIPMAPRINQLHFTDNSRVAWDAEFAKFVLDRLELYVPRLAEVPELRASAYRGEPAQRQTRAFILELCRHSPKTWESCIRKWVYDHPVMSVLGMRSAVGSRGDMRAILENLRLDPPARSLITYAAVDLRPACFAVPAARDPGAPACAVCSFANECGAVSKLVVKKIELDTGHPDPRGHEFRQKANARQRKSYHKTRAKKLALASQATSPAVAAGNLTSP